MEHRTHDLPFPSRYNISWQTTWQTDLNLSQRRAYSSAVLCDLLPPLNPDRPWPSALTIYIAIMKPHMFHNCLHLDLSNAALHAGIGHSTFLHMPSLAMHDAWAVVQGLHLGYICWQCIMRHTLSWSWIKFLRYSGWSGQKRACHHHAIVPYIAWFWTSNCMDGTIVHVSCVLGK